ncbi:MAG: type II toxin-antitoxin system RelE/ParE family toxin [Clostridia bacterium]|nr:type II toxin-antitoxin system RelE/ParE family toxin [Clostridia bacterium]
MAADYSFFFTEIAAADLNETLDYISEELSNPTAAQSFIQKMETAISTIRTFPLSGSPVDNPYVKRNDIRKVPVGNYVLYYLPDHFKHEIIILRIVYGPRDRDQIETKL